MTPGEAAESGVGSSPAGQAVRPDGVELCPLTLMREAAERAGQQDWGEETFVEPLTLLIESCRATGRVNQTGWRVLRSIVLRHLRNRLAVQAHLAREPAAAERPLTDPVVITGLPRTGTSLLHGLLSQDPRHRYLRLWEALRPIPPAGGQGPDETTLVGQAEAWLERFYALTPGFRSVHPLTPRGPEECDALLQNAFASQHLDDMFDAEAYSSWFYGTDLGREYAYYALQLRVLNRDREADRRWVLKSPGHIGHLDSLLASLPGARVLHCHRDPAEAIPSYASLILTARLPNSDDVSPERVGEQALDRCRAALARALAVRAAESGERFLDVSFPALVADPIDTAARVYEWLGRRLDPAVEAAMRSWLADHPRDLHGAHRYDPQAFGLPADRVRGALGAYLDRFAPVMST